MNVVTVVGVMFADYFFLNLYVHRKKPLPSLVKKSLIYSLSIIFIDKLRLLSLIICAVQKKNIVKAYKKY